MTRNQLIKIANDTLAIIEHGSYTNAQGENQSVKTLVKNCVKQTSLYTPEQLDEIAKQKIPTGKFNTLIEITKETTLQAAKRLSKEKSVLALNFASATSPGGGFLRGSLAQEESIARASGLYQSLISQTKYYVANKKLKNSLYTNHIIVSPDVPIFKDDYGTLLDKPYIVSILTVPAVNINPLKGGAILLSDVVYETMAYRMVLLLSLACHLKYDTLILGAWGCGAFGNDPKLIAKLFRENLRSKFFNVFKRVVFAIYDSSKEQNIYNAFAKEFAS